MRESKSAEKEDGEGKTERIVCLCDFELVSIPGRKQVEKVLKKAHRESKCDPSKKGGRKREREIERVGANPCVLLNGGISHGHVLP